MQVLIIKWYVHFPFDWQKIFPSLDRLDSLHSEDCESIWFIDIISQYLHNISSLKLQKKLCVSQIRLWKEGLSPGSFGNLWSFSKKYYSLGKHEQSKKLKTK